MDSDQHSHDAQDPEHMRNGHGRDSDERTTTDVVYDRGAGDGDYAIRYQLEAILQYARPVNIDCNQQTIQSYEAHVQEFINGTPHDVSGALKDWIDEAVSGLPEDADVLEFGSAFGRDASYLHSLGYKVECSDATQSFVDLLKLEGFNARKLNAITDELGRRYDLVLANAVLLHFSRDEAKSVLTKVYASLKDNGRFAFTLKQGDGEKWTDDKLGAPRYFCFWRANQIRQLVKDTGFTDVKVNGDIASSNATWLQIVATK
jgi:SAM-dependent methyltransferase